MTHYSITQPRPDVVRVAFPQHWNAAAESEAMFGDLLAALDSAGGEVTLLIVANEERPAYSSMTGLTYARDILTHDNIKKIVIVADDPSPAVTHMGAMRGEHGLPPVVIVGCQTEAEAESQL